MVTEKVVKSKKPQKYEKTAVFLPKKAEFCEIQKTALIVSKFGPKEAIYQISSKFAH